MKSKILKIAFSIVLLAGFISLQTFATLASEERKIGSINIEITRCVKHVLTTSFSV